MSSETSNGQPLYDAAAMRVLDRWAIDECGVEGVELMEQAGLGLATFVEERLSGGRVVIVCGAGNNGGDGYVAARYLRDWGNRVDVVSTVSVDRLNGDARVNAERLSGPQPVPFNPTALVGATVVVDAILGTGATGAPRDAAAEAIEAINGCGADVVACDVPSGVDVSTGEVPGTAIRASATVTFGALKPGLFVAPGKQLVGETRLVRLAYPDGWPVDPVGTLLSPGRLHAVPGRDPASTKFTSGHVVIAGGSRGLSGATCLAASAATRAGAGYVTACVPAALIDVVEARSAEVMTAVLPGPDSHHSEANVAPILERLDSRGGALVLGPGLGTAEQVVPFARDLARSARVPLVLDADGLNAHAGELEALAGRTHPTVLTPHAGELARLLETTTDIVQAARIAHAREAARRADAVVVLKGDDTLIVGPGDGAHLLVSRGDAPALATAGTGDVLAGMIGALLAKGLDATTAAATAVTLHAEAGRVAARKFGSPDGVVASDVIDALPYVVGSTGLER